MNILNPAFHPALKGVSKFDPIPFSLKNNAPPPNTNYFLLALARLHGWDEMKVCWLLLKME